MALNLQGRASPRAVYVTGLGVITAAGAGLAETWAGVAANRKVVEPVRQFDIRGCECQVAAQVAETVLPAPPPRARWPRVVRLSHAALGEALGQTGLLGADGQCTDSSLPLWCSTTGGGTEYGEVCVARARAGRQAGVVAAAVRYQAQFLPHALQEVFGLSGPAATLSNACASGADLLGAAARLVASGRVERIAVGGAESLSALLFHGFSCLRALSPSTCRPFSVSRDGLWLGEGAAFMILESGESLRRRRIQPRARLAGYGQATDLHHLTQPHPEGRALVLALREALAQAGVAPDEVAYVNAHGTGTVANDESESRAYATVFGEYLPRVALSSSKHILGHTLGAAGVIEAVLTVEGLRRSRPLPAAAIADPLPELAASLEHSRVAHVAGRAFVSTNSGFGGANAALVFTHP
jgi:3-oxoacyl-[acyl-carrier-protein] synthase II